MAVYKLFPSKDTTLYSYYPLMNTGLDAICEVSNTLDPIGLDLTKEVCNTLDLKFIFIFN